MANKIQLRRDTTANWNNVNPILADGEPGLDITTNQVKYGDGANVWANLSYASGGGGGDSIVNGNYSVSVGANGVVTMETSRGSLEFGALPEIGGPSHFHIMRASGDNADLYFGDDFNYVLQPGPASGPGHPPYGVEIGTKDIVAGSQNVWRFETDGILTMPPGNETTSGWIQWSHASDDLTNVAGAGFVDYFNAYSGLGLTAPTDTNAEKGIWFGTPADPTNPFQPETSMVFRNDTLYLPKNGYIKSHDINRVGYANLTTVGTSVTIQTSNNNVYDWTFSADGSLTFPSDLNILSNPNFGGTVLYQANAALQMASVGIGGTTQIGWAENADTPGNVASVDFNVTSGNISLKTGNVLTPSTWTFDNTGNLTLPAGGEIKSATGTGNVVVQSNNGATGYKWTFETSGALILPTVGGNEGAEIDFTKAPNSTLSGSSVIVDQYVDQIRFFEGGGTSRGAYINLKQAAAGVGTLLNNRVSGFVNAGAFVTMDLLKATVTTTSNRGLSLAATTGTFAIRIAGTYAKTSTTGGARADVTLTTTPEASMFDWDFSNAGDLSTYIITDTTNNRSYRITLQIGYLYNDNMISIERLI